MPPLSPVESLAVPVIHPTSPVDQFSLTYKYHLIYIFAAGINDTLGFLFFTYNLTIFGQLLPFLQDYIFPSSSSSIIVFLASAPNITAAIAALIGGHISAKIGRKNIMIIADIIGIIGVILTLFESLPVMIIGRLCVGFTIGIITVAVPLYFIEITPLKYRGPISGGPTFFASLGTLLGFLGGFAIPKTLYPGETSQAWRVFLGLSMVVPIIRILAFLIFFRDETPYYLVDKNKIEDAQKTLERVYKVGAEQRLQEIVQDVDYTNAQGKVPFRDLVAKKYRKALFVATILMIMQMIAPLNIVVVFAQEIFKAGIDDPDSKLPQVLAVILAAVNVIFAIVFISIAGRFGRRPMLIIGTFFVGLCDILFGVLGLAISSGSMASKIFLILWAVPFPMSLGPLPFAIVPETLPPRAVSIATLFNWIFAFLTVQFYPNMADSMGENWTFIMFGCITVLASFFFFMMVIETKRKNQDEILRAYNGMPGKTEQSRQIAGNQA